MLSREIKQAVSVAAIVAAAFLFCVEMVAAQSSSERIVSFDTSIELRTDRSAIVREVIRYDFGENRRHGIFRTIPYRYEGKLGSHDEIPLSGFSVMLDGVPVPFELTRGGGNVSLKIGDANVYISGERVYELSYRADDAAGAFDGYDELYWNTTGTGWPVPIESATARVTLPGAVAAADARLACYADSFGGGRPCGSALGPFADGTEFVFNAGRPLAPGEGMTVAVGFPKGLIAERSAPAVAARFFALNLIVLLPLVVFAFMFFHWRRHGRDPKGRGIIVAEYDVPEGLSPLEVAALMRQRVSASDIPAGIIELAVKGYLRIEQIEKTFLGMKLPSDYRFIELKPKGDDLHAGEQELVRLLFSSGARQEYQTDLRTVTLSDLRKERFASKIALLSREVMNGLVAAGYFPNDPWRVTKKYALIGGIGVAPGLFLVQLFFQSPIAFISVIATGITVIVFGVVMPKVTPAGALLKERVLGLKEYLQIAEKDRLAFHNAPEKKPETFEKFLPFAMALGVEKAWAKEFEGIAREPSWYVGAHGHAFSAVAFTDSMHSFATATSAAVNPHSSSGSGGGGFSGGGGGGGGGGSW